MRRRLMLTGFLVLALLPVAAAAVSPDRPPRRVHAVIAPSITADKGTLNAPVPASPAAARFAEAARLFLIGSGLMTLAAVVRKTRRTR